MRKLAAVGLMLCAFGALSCGAEAPESTESLDAQSEAVINGFVYEGESATDFRKPATVRIRNMSVLRFCPGLLGLGTGVLLEQEYVLTARHVVEGRTTGCVKT